MVATADPWVWIEEERFAPSGRQCYVRYRNTDGRRWEVIGTCDMRGDCLKGAVDPLLGERRHRLDVPITPGFTGCCPFTFRELERGD